MPAQPTDNPVSESPAASAVGLSAASLKTLDDLAKANQLRQLRVLQPNAKYITHGRKQLLNLASNDYLALSQHPKLIEAAVAATREHGVGAGASRLVSGTQPMHEALEHRFAKFKHAEAALLLPTGYTANLAVLTTLAGPGDLIVLDKLVHASLIDGARASSAEVRTFAHLNLERAEQLLRRHATGRRFLVTDSVFSMDGDYADLPAMCDLADRCDASLIVDEAHGTGILGTDGSGLASAQGVASRIYTCGTGGIVVSTASKALGSLGGFITADQSIIDLLINKARPFIYSTAVPPAQAASILAALDVIEEEPGRRKILSKYAAKIRDVLKSTACSNTVVADRSQGTPIIPFIAGDERTSLAIQQTLFEAGLFAPAIRPPTVAPYACRIRFSLRCDLAEEDIDLLIKQLHELPSASKRISQQGDSI